MQDTPTARLASRLLSWGLPFFYFLTSIAFYLRTYDSAQVKITIVQMLGAVLIAGFYVARLSEGRPNWDRFGPFVVPLLVSLASGIQSWIFCAYPGNSVDEGIRRIIYVHLALIALFEINTVERMRRMLKFLLAATAVATIYGLIQYLDYRFYPVPTPGMLDPFVWRQAFSDRIFSTFGNPNFYGNFLVIVAPITLALLLRRNREKPVAVLGFAVATIVVSAMLWQCGKILIHFQMREWINPAFMTLFLSYLLFATLRFSWLGILFFLITLTNFLTVSKGAWVGYAGSFISFLMLVLFFFAQFRSEKIKRAIQHSAWITLALMAIAVGYYSKDRPDSIRFRLVTWTSTWEIAQQHPLFGNGIGSFRVLYPAYRRPQIFHIEGKHNTETDHAEDEYLEVLMDEGIVGFGIFLWLIAMFSATGMRALRRFSEGLVIKDVETGRRRTADDPRAYYLLGFLAAFWGMLMHNFMDVSLRFVSSGIFLWLLMGLIGALTAHDPMPASDPVETPSGKPPPDDAGVPMPCLIAGSFCAVGFALLTWRVLREFSNAQERLPPSFGEALLWGIAWAAVLITVGLVLYALVRLSLSIRRWFVYAVLLAFIYPLQVFWGFFMADVHHNRGIFFSKQGRWEDAIRNYETTVRLNPEYLMAYYFMGNVYTDRWQAGDYERAMEQYEKLWTLAPNYVQSHHQAGLVHLKKAQEDRQRWDQLRAQGRSAEAAAMLGALRKEWGEALNHFEKYHLIDPVFEGNFARAAWVHLQMAEVANLVNQPQEAQSHLDAAEAQYKEAVEAWGCRKPEHDMMGENWERHHRHYHRPYASEMFENLGQVRFMRGRISGAERAFSLAMWCNPENARALKNWITMNARLGRMQDVAKGVERLRAIAPNDPDLQRMMPSHGAALQRS